MLENDLKIREDLIEADEKVVLLLSKIFSKLGLFARHLITKKLISVEPHRDLQVFIYLLSLNPIRISLTLSQIMDETGMSRKIIIRAIRSLAKLKYITIMKEGRDGRGFLWELVINPEMSSAFTKGEYLKVPFTFLDNKKLDKLNFSTSNLFVLLWNIKEDDGSFEYRPFNSVFFDCFDPKTHRAAFKELVDFNVIRSFKIVKGTFKGEFINPMYWGNKKKMEEDDAANKLRQTLMQAAQIYKNNPAVVDQVAYDKRLKLWQDIQSEYKRLSYDLIFSTITLEEDKIMKYPIWFAACKEEDLLPDDHPVLDLLDELVINGKENLDGNLIIELGDELLKPNTLNMTAEQAGEFLGRQLRKKTHISKVKLAQMLEKMDFTDMDINLNRRDAGLKVRKAAPVRSPGKFKPTEKAKWDMDLLQKEKEAHEAKVAEYKLIKAASKKGKN